MSVSLTCHEEVTMSGGQPKRYMHFLEELSTIIDLPCLSVMIIKEIKLPKYYIQITHY